MKKAALLKEIQNFLTKYCQQERRLSRETILSYRDTLKLFILFFRDQCKRQPASLTVDDLSYESVADFLNNLEKQRNSSISTRNQRLSAMKSFCKYLLFRCPDYADTLSRAMNVPLKKKTKKTRNFLEPNEVTAILNSIEVGTWTGRRDHVLIDLCVRTGIRVSELATLKIDNVVFGKSPYITVVGKGRKERSIPLDRRFAKKLSRWHQDRRVQNQQYLFPTIQGTQMSTDAIQHLLRKYVMKALKTAPSLAKKRISPHTLRHTTAMQLLDRGVDIQIIALWLGHEQIDTTQIYFSESLALKRKALKKTRLVLEIPPPKLLSSDLDFLDEL